MNPDPELVEAAAAVLAGVTDRGYHTVGAAVRTADGSIHTGTNLYHFTGGPCAEMVALANAAGAQPIRIVAVGDDGRGVLPPCGRCRQIMLDLCPDIEVLLPGLRVGTVAELLPESYRWSRGT